MKKKSVDLKNYAASKVSILVTWITLTTDLLLTGASEYTHLFIEYHFDLLDVLNAFPSCTPPLPRLIGTITLVHYFSTTMLL